jgi:hypothetical protein
VQILQIDLNVKVLPFDHKVWRLFPGRGYSFQKAVYEQGLAFLDFPGLFLPPGEVNENTPHLLQSVQRSLKIKDWYGSSNSTGSPPKAFEPKGDYTPTVTSEIWPTNLLTFRSNIVALFGGAKNGDLIVVPLSGRDRSLVIGEFVGEPSDRTQAKYERYEEFVLPARKIKWLKHVTDYQVGYNLTSKFRSQNAFVLVARSETRKIYELAYGAYVLGEECASTFTTGEGDYDSQLDAQFQVIVLVAAAATERCVAKIAHNLNGNIYEAMRVKTSPEYIPSNALNINSPGTIRLISATISPLVAACLFAMVLDANADPENPPQPSSVEVTSSISPEDPCYVEVRDATRSALEMLGIAGWRDACEVAKKLKERVKLDSQAKIK